jgi:hypothetical protein
MSEAIYSVWVGGVEVNDFYLTREAAATIAEEYSNDGYEDVYITATIELKK